MTDPVTLSFDAGILARGWLSAFLASGKDPETPILCQTVHLEVYPDGARFTATDRYMLLTAWVPSLDGDEEPDLGTAPDQSVVFRDHDLRAKGLLSYLRKLAIKAAKDSLPIPTATLRLGVKADEGDAPGFPGMELEQVALEFPGNESVRLDCVEGVYPDWRKLIVGHKRVKVDTVVLNPELLERVAALGKIHGSFIHFGLGGDRKMVSLSPSPGLNESPVIRGGLMPVATADAVGVPS